MLTTHQEIALLRSRVAELEEQLRITEERTASIVWPLSWRLQMGDARLLTALYQVAPRLLSVEGCFLARWPNGDEPEFSSEALRASIRRLRKKLAPFGIVIRTERGFGRCITAEGKATLASLLQDGKH